METSKGKPSRDTSPEVLAILRCLGCNSPLVKVDGGLSCSKCKRVYPAVNGVVRFVESEEYVGSFSFEWDRYSLTQLDNEHSNESERTLRRKTGLSPEELSGKLVLDAGCGVGRFAEVASRWGAKVVGFDLSRAVEMAARNLGDRENLWVSQADLFNLPFAPMSFDYIYSIGVLQHTPDAAKAFKALVQFLKPGGTISISVYSGYNKWYRMADFYRRLTTKLPQKMLHTLSYVAVPLYHVHRGLRWVPVIGSPASSALSYFLPTSPHPVPAWRVLDTFNWYAPPFQSKHTYEEVFRWFEESGLEDMRVLSEPISMRARRPAASSDNQAETRATTVSNGEMVG
ncbi:MAG TPA: methyltransferase domain-containing protein [Terriglobia bacterium]|nr:methyltransferase domain-containing protein [Terriglobia bacterium]